MINPEDYMLYGFLAFISLLQVTIIAMLFRQSRDIGRLEGQISGIHDQIRGIHDQLSSLTARIETARRTGCQPARTGCRNQRNADLPERARGPVLAPSP